MDRNIQRYPHTLLSSRVAFCEWASKTTIIDPEWDTSYQVYIARCESCKHTFVLPSRSAHV